MFVNLTPHALNVRVGEAEIVIPPSGSIARAAQTVTPCGEIDGIPVYRTTYGAVEGLPAPVDGTWYIVSSLTAQAVKDRNDILIPGPAVRDNDGRIIGCQGFSVV